MPVHFRRKIGSKSQIQFIGKLKRRTVITGGGCTILSVCFFSEVVSGKSRVAALLL